MTKVEPLRPDLYPTTSNIGFVSVPPLQAAKAVAGWWEGPSVLEEVADSFERIVQRLHPLDPSAHTRFAFVPTRSRWTAFFGRS
jgi:hypothetical protein